MSEAGIQDTASPQAPPQAPGGRPFVQRLLGALRLEGAAFEEIANDSGAILQAAGVVVLAALGPAIGFGVLVGIRAGLYFAINVILSWPFVSLLIWAIGGFFGHKASFGRVLRVVGFAMAPLMLSVGMLIANVWVQTVVRLIACALLFAALVVGVRHALRTDTGRSAFVCAVVFFILVFLTLLGNFFLMRPAGAS